MAISERNHMRLDQARAHQSRLSGVEGGEQQMLALLQDRVKELTRALRPFASIALVRDEQPGGKDMIDAPDLCITPRQVRRARKALETR